MQDWTFLDGCSSIPVYCVRGTYVRFVSSVVAMECLTVCKEPTLQIRLSGLHRAIKICILSS